MMSHLQVAGFSLCRLAVLVAWGLFLFGCAGGQYEENGFFDKDSGNRLFEKNFELIARYHIAPPPTRNLALAGIENLTTLDPDIGISLRRDSVLLSHGGQDLFLLSLPAGNDHGAWARLTSSIITVIQQETQHLERLRNGAIYQAVLDGMMGELDRFSRYANPEEIEKARNKRDGYEGIGITLIADKDSARILSVFSGGPAEESGLKAGDKIIQINAESVVGLSESELIEKITGPADTAVELTVQKRTGETLTISVVRRFVEIQTIYAQKRESIGLIRIDSFVNRNVSNDFEDALDDLVEGGLKGLIIDLRDNGGGLVSMATQIADIFLERNKTILVTEGRHKRSSEHYTAGNGDILKGLPLVVLINGNSASAAEILTAALKYNRRAVVVGSRSFGKGSVQKPFSLPNGGEVSLTWSLFYTPSGQPIHEQGVAPTICTAQNGFDSTHLKQGQFNKPKDCPQAIESSVHDEDTARIIVQDPVLFNRLRQ